MDSMLKLIKLIGWFFKYLQMLSTKFNLFDKPVNEVCCTCDSIK